MAEPINMPELGSNMEEGTLLNWLKDVGETVSTGDVIAEIETDKATVEVESDHDGTILSLMGEPGDTISVGAVMAYVGAPGEEVPAGGAAAAQPAAQTEAAGGSASEPAHQVEAPPPAVTETAPAPSPPRENGAAENGNFPDGVKASPVARNIAHEKGIDLRQVQGTGRGGRITKSDVENFTPSKQAAPAQQPQRAAAAPAPGLPALSYGPLPSGPDVEIIDVSKLRTRIAARMVDSKQQVPHFYVTSDMDAAPLLALRKQLNANVTDEAQKITVNDLVIKAAALTLRDFPNLNTHFYGDKLVRYKRIHIGIAVALPNGGLINVVAKDADKTALGTMAAKNKEMIARAREGKVRPEDIDGSTFTVSNLGAFEVDHFIAIINPPEAGILAVGSAKNVPIVNEEGELTVGTRMKVTISVDHRVSDGAEGAEYMKAFKDMIENPMRLVL